MIKRISIVPRWDFHRGNRLFDRPESCTAHEAFRSWRQAAAKEGFALDTDDICPPSTADGVWFVDLPRRRRLFAEVAGSLSRSTKMVLQVLESPLVSPHAFCEENLRNFDMVLTYCTSGPENPGTYRYRIPNTIVPWSGDLPFAERRCVVMVNSNRMEGWLASSRMDLRRFPGLGKYVTGWKTPVMQFLHPARGELYSWRRKFARAAEKYQDTVLDIHGEGWRGERISWLPLPGPRPYRGATEAPRAGDEALRNYHAKYPLMAGYRFGVAVENYRGDKGYISEKMIDVMRAGAVPVYWGDESIGKEFPQGSFVDVREFRNCAELLSYLRNCREEEWMEMREKGRLFLNSPASLAFSNEAFVGVAMEILKRMCPPARQEPSGPSGLAM